LSLAQGKKPLIALRLHNAGYGLWLSDGNTRSAPSPPQLGVTNVRKALVGSLLLFSFLGGSGCHELQRMEHWKNERLFGRKTCFPQPEDECDGGGPVMLEELPVYAD
jgi:hypothetical protein